jgi:cell wall-associated NlpC family hydrolase
MTRKLIYFPLLLLIVSCGSSKKKVANRDERRVSVAVSGEVRPTNGNVPLKEGTELSVRGDGTSHRDVNKVINTALQYAGVRYKYGGTTKSGMDCSGLMFVSFAEHDYKLPRTSTEMAEEGKKIRINEVGKGDLLFFSTGRRNNRINHVGLVVDIDGNDIKFIHSSTSRGVIVSSLREGYWNSSFVKATRVF